MPVVRRGWPRVSAIRYSATKRGWSRVWTMTSVTVPTSPLSRYSSQYQARTSTRASRLVAQVPPGTTSHPNRSIDVNLRSYPPNGRASQGHRGPLQGTRLHDEAYRAVRVQEEVQGRLAG